MAANELVSIMAKCLPQAAYFLEWIEGLMELGYPLVMTKAFQSARARPS